MIGIVILNYNTWDETVCCISTIIKYTTVKYKIYVVDNCSIKVANADQIEYINRYATLIYNKNNTGYAAGNNVGLNIAYNDGCDSFLICNSDIQFVDDSISVLYDYSNADLKNIGIVGPLLYNTEGAFQPIYMLTKLTALGKIKNMFLSTPLKKLLLKFEKNFIRHEPVSEPLSVFGLSGCCFLITKKCYETCFPFDEHTFLYEEEYILGCRLEEKNLKAYVIPNTYVIHAHGKSTGGINEFSYKCLIESEQYYLKEYIHSNCIMLFIIRLLRKLIKIFRTFKRV